ncbi:MAG TPA: hypothetical protein VGQ77_02535, partial [Methylomirabilota bacterium]|nr:hypothetical protein [Methylomirabilota bacterium]
MADGVGSSRRGVAVSAGGCVAGADADSRGAREGELTRAGGDEPGLLAGARVVAGGCAGAPELRDAPSSRP